MPEFTLEKPKCGVCDGRGFFNVTGDYLHPQDPARYDKDCWHCGGDTVEPPNCNYDCREEYG